MPVVDFVRQTQVKETVRVNQLSGMFDVPFTGHIAHQWAVNLPIEVSPWNVGLIVGPSGSGKTQIARQIWGPGVDVPLSWRDDSAVVDDFAAELSINDITAVCSSVGFNTIPSWLKPYRILSNGEQFRVSLARRLLEQPSPVIVDEFTSVVDRQVAQICSYAIGKYIRAQRKQFVAISCHYDIIDWLQPDWVYRTDNGSFERRLLRRRPPIECAISRVDKTAWKTFAPYHYMSADLHSSAVCYVLFVEGRPASFAGVIARPVSSGPNKGTAIRGVSRLVTLPDWQGLGLAFVLLDELGSMFKKNGIEFSMYPAHPSLVASFERSNLWRNKKKFGTYTPMTNSNSKHSGFGGRMNAVYSYCGPSCTYDPSLILAGA